MPTATSTPAVERARTLADDLIRPLAEQVDRTVVPRTHLDALPAGEQLEDRLVVRTTVALVAASGGSAMSRDAAPQRLAREAMFRLVQAQTGPTREATLQLLRELGA